MPQSTIQAQSLWKARDRQLLQILNSGVLEPKNRQIRFYAPSFTYYKTRYYCSNSTDFPTVSVTGNACALKCKHCEGRVLETMHPAVTPEKLIALCETLKQKGTQGILISGGCTPEGNVPLEPFTEAISKIKRDLNLTVFVHTGTVEEETARKLKIAGVDAALIDVIGSNDTLLEIYNLKITTKDYEQSLRALDTAGIPFIPHIIVGLHHGKLKGERKALEIVASYEPSALVIIGFMPIHGTSMATTKPPSSLDIARVTAIARLMFPKTPVVLGCMRPKGKQRIETDMLALKAGVDAIAFPSDEAVVYAKNQGLRFSFSSFCCAQIYKDLAP